MTLQTELVGAPAQIVTLIDLRGRVLHRWTCPERVGAADHAQVRRWHEQIEAQVRAKLAGVTRSGQSHERAQARFGAELFVEAMRAYLHRDFATAEALLEACAAMLADDPRVEAARAHISARHEALRVGASKLASTKRAHQPTPPNINSPTTHQKRPMGGANMPPESSG